MSKELPRTYKSFTEWDEKSKQIEYTQATPLLSADGKLLAKGWARRNYFEYDRNKVKSGLTSRKEWDFYNIQNDEMQLLISFANIHIGGYVGVRLVNIRTGGVILDSNEYFTVSFFDNEYRQDLATLGIVSGREGDKIAKTDLTPVAVGETFGFKEAKLTLLCKKIYRQDLDKSMMPADVVEKYYTDEAEHTMYVGEVVDIIEQDI